MPTANSQGNDRLIESVTRFLVATYKFRSVAVGVVENITRMSLREVFALLQGQTGHWLGRAAWHEQPAPMFRKSEELFLWR